MCRGNRLDRSAETAGIGAGGGIGSADGQIAPFLGPIGAARGQIETFPGPISAARGQIETFPGPIGAARGQIATFPGPIGAALGQIATFLGQIGAARGQIGAFFGSRGTRARHKGSRLAAFFVSSLREAWDVCDRLGSAHADNDIKAESMKLGLHPGYGAQGVLRSMSSPSLLPWVTGICGTTSSAVNGVPSAPTPRR